MTHAPISIFTRKTYQESILIPIPFTSGGIISGNKIDVEKGYYKYKGKIEIEGATVNVNLLIDDTDYKKLRPLTWNGNYHLIRQ